MSNENISQTGKHLAAKQHLNQLRRLEIFIQQKEGEANDILRISKAFGMSETMKTLLIEIERETGAFRQRREAILDEIQGIKREPCATLLYKRYAEGKDFETISQEMIYTSDWIRHLHELALKEFEKQYPEYTE